MTITEARKVKLKEEAGKAYATAARKHFGEFALPVGSK